MSCQAIIKIFIFLAIALSASSALAAVYSVDAVEINLENIDNPRGTAIVQAQQKALRQLLERLTGTDPSLMLATIPDSRIGDYVSAVRIESEKFLGTRYLGHFSIEFIPEAIQRLIERGAHGSQLSSSVPRNVIVTVQFSDLPHWVALRQRLFLVSGVLDINTQSLSQDQAILLLHTTLSTSILRQNLEQKGFVIEENPQGLVLRQGEQQ
ncbi:MAG: hypothetical protein ACK5O1_01600 [Holosporales bacterium]